MKFIRKKLLLIVCAAIILSGSLPLVIHSATETRVATVRYITNNVTKNITNYKGSPCWYALFERVKEVYGETAEELYLQGVATGDYYAYRSYVNVWVPVSKDPNLYPVTYNGTTIKTSTFQFLSDESAVYDAMGKYATFDDYINYLISKGWSGKGNSGVFILMNNITLPTITSYTGTQATTNSTTSSAVEALKTYSGNTTEFNAYNYYMRYSDLQTAIGADGDKLLAHYNKYGKTEGRNAK